MTGEKTFTEALTRRADAVHGAPLTFEDVRGRAHRIRRRRAGAAAVVAAVVAAVIVLPLALTGGTDRSAPDPAPDPSPSLSVVPGASVLHDGVLTLPDGSTVPLDVDNADVEQVGVLTDGRVVVASSRPYAVLVFSPQGRLESEYPVAANAITMSADDRLVAWVDETFRIAVLESGVAEPATLHGIPMPGESPGSIDAVLGSGCASGGCTVLGGDYSTTTTETTATGARGLVTSEPLRITDVSPDGRLWAVTLPRPDADPQFGCSGLYDPEAERLVAENCDTSSLHFAPDGRHLTGARGDNNMFGQVDVFDLDLQRVGTYSPAPRVISRIAWADDAHVLAVVAGLEDRQWSVVRVGLDGSDPEVVEGPAAGGNPEMSTEYLPSE
jgi:hypothetical protein